MPMCVAEARMGMIHSQADVIAETRATRFGRLRRTSDAPCSGTEARQSSRRSPEFIIIVRVTAAVVALAFLVSFRSLLEQCLSVTANARRVRCAVRHSVSIPAACTIPSSDTPQPRILADASHPAGCH